MKKELILFKEKDEKIKQLEELLEKSENEKIELKKKLEESLNENKSKDEKIISLENELEKIKMENNQNKEENNVNIFNSVSTEQILNENIAMSNGINDKN